MPQQDIFDSIHAQMTGAPVPPASMLATPDIFDQIHKQTQAAQMPAPPLTGYDQQQRDMTSAQLSDAAHREFLLGASEQAGIDPSHPFKSVAQGLINAFTGIPRLATHADELHAAVGGMVQQAPDIWNELKDAYTSGDSAKWGLGIGRALTYAASLGLLAKGGVEAVKIAEPLAPLATGMGLPEASGAPFDQRPPVPPHVDALTTALNQDGKIFSEDRFHQAATAAFPDLKRAELRALGRPVADIRDVADVAKYAKDQPWKAYQGLLDRTSTPITRTDLLKGAVANLPDTMLKTQYSDWESAVGGFAKDLSQGKYTANEIESAAQALNAKLKAYYQKNNLDRASAMKLPATAGDEALLASYRTLLDSTVKSDTGYDPAPLRQKYGQLKAIENAAINQPSGDDTLFESLTRNPSTVTSPKATVMKGVLSKLMGQTPDQQAARAFKLFKPETPQTGLVHVPQPPAPPPGQPITATVHAGPSGPPGGYQMPPIIRGLIPDKTSGVQGLIADRTATLTPPAPSESFSEALARTQTPQSAQLRQGQGKGPYDKQTAPVTAEEYLQSKGGTAFPPSAKSVSKTPKPIPPRKPGTK